MKVFFILLPVFISLSYSNNHKRDVAYSHLKDRNIALLLTNDIINTGKPIQKYLRRQNLEGDGGAEVSNTSAQITGGQTSSGSAELLKKLQLLGSEEKIDHIRELLSKFFGNVDPVFDGRRKAYDYSDSQSSSRELRDWKTEWREMWMKKKMEALNATPPTGDIVNIVAARPWGVPCGDPGQHDLPWGTCVLSTECDGEYRIYRGDHFCGRTYFVCCSLQFSSYDTNLGFDLSLEDSNLQTDSAEELQKYLNSPLEAQKRRLRDKRRRIRLREQRKQKIRRTIVRIIKEVRKILNRAFRNGTKMKRKKTKTMKKFIQYLKRQYRKDRDSVKELHEQAMWEVDHELMDRLLQIKDLNKEFMNNATFRNVIMNKTITPQSAHMLTQAYPELAAVMAANIMRSNANAKLPAKSSKPERDGSKPEGRGRKPENVDSKLQRWVANRESKGLTWNGIKNLKVDGNPVNVDSKYKSGVGKRLRVDERMDETVKYPSGDGKLLKADTIRVIGDAKRPNAGDKRLRDDTIQVNGDAKHPKGNGVRLRVELPASAVNYPSGDGNLLRVDTIQASEDAKQPIGDNKLARDDGLPVNEKESLDTIQVNKNVDNSTVETKPPRVADGLPANDVAIQLSWNGVQRSEFGKRHRLGIIQDRGDATNPRGDAKQLARDIKRLTGNQQKASERLSKGSEGLKWNRKRLRHAGHTKQPKLYGARRSGDFARPLPHRRKYLEYDIEYGLLYS